MAKSKEEIITWLEQNQPKSPSLWRERAEWRRANRSWIRRSQEIAIQMLDAMEAQHLTQSALASRMGCSQQYVSKVLKGQENLSLETICKIEDSLGLTLLMPSPRKYQFDEEDSGEQRVADY